MTRDSAGGRVRERGRERATDRRGESASENPKSTPKKLGATRRPPSRGFAAAEDPEALIHIQDREDAYAPNELDTTQRYPLTPPLSL